VEAGLVATLLGSVVAWVLLTAGVDKALHLSSFQTALREQLGMKRPVGHLVAPGICLLEIVIGAGLLVGIARIELGLGAALLIVVLTAGSAWRRTLRSGEGCACGGLADSNGGPAHSVINGALAIAALTSAALTSAGGPEPNLFEGGPELVSVALLALVLLLVARSAATLASLHRRWSEIDKRRMS
jgi:uncharacterized membrane protein YphA (DoxX/SURF4 family)